MRFRPARHSSLAEVVLDQILARMSDNSLRPGERLPNETELARLFQVGRSSVREALRVLVVMRLIETRPGRGAYVLRKPAGLLPAAGSHVGVAQHLERMAMQDLLEAREAIEGRAAELAAERATRTEIRDIERCALAVERKVSAGKSYFRANLEFHVAVAKASHNQIFAESVRELLGQLRSFRERLMAEEPIMRERDVAEHGAMLEAIKAGNGIRARQLAIQHIRTANETASRFGVAGTVAPLKRRIGGAKRTSVTVSSISDRSGRTQ